MRVKKLTATLPAWALVGLLLALGSGAASWCFTPQVYNPCGYSCYNPCYSPCYDPSPCYGPCGYGPEINVNQQNVGNGHDRNNYVEASTGPGGPYPWYGWYGWYGWGGEVNGNQANIGDGDHRDNVAITNGGGGGGGGININQANIGNGDNRDNVAYATWAW